MLRVKRLAAAIDMIATGMIAPIAIAAKAKPVIPAGSLSRSRSGTR